MQHHTPLRRFWGYEAVARPYERDARGRASDLQKELETLFESQNRSPNKLLTSIPATFLRVTIARP
jgi:hypothetical protein